MGRPTKYKTEMCQQLEGFMSTGLTRKEAAKALEISYNTFLSYIDRYDEFAIAAKNGDALAEAYWTEQFKQGALGMNKDQNPAMMIFYMKSRFDWKEKTEVDISAERKIDTYQTWLKNKKAAKS